MLAMLCSEGEKEEKEKLRTSHQPTQVIEKGWQYYFSSFLSIAFTRMPPSRDYICSNGKV